MFLNSVFNVPKISLSILLGVISVFGDCLVDASKPSHHFLEAIFDNLTHACVGGLSAFIIVMDYHDRLTFLEQKMLIVFGFLAAGLIDVDHFIEAKSFRLKVQTN